VHLSALDGEIHALENFNAVDGGAQAAGLSAGDVVIAVDGIKVTNGTLDPLLARRARGSTVRVHAFRRDELIEREVRLGRTELAAEIKPAADAGEAALRQRRNWLGK
jgi:predicted metalloprotease with PDZ domain